MRQLLVILLWSAALADSGFPLDTKSLAVNRDAVPAVGSAEPEENGSRDWRSDPLDQGAASCPGVVIPSLPFTDTGTTIGMGNNFSEQTPCGTFSGPDVFYSLTVVNEGIYRVSLCGSSYDTKLEVRFYGACPGSLRVECDDNSCGQQSVVEFAGLAGMTYYIIVDGFIGGAYVINVSYEGSNGADACPATEITSLPFTHRGTTVGTGDHYGGINDCGFTTGRDVIYKWVASHSGWLHVSLCGSDYNTVLQIRRGASCPGTLYDQCVDDYCGLNAAWTIIVDRDSTYYFVVDGHAGDGGGSYLLSVTAPCDIQQQPGDIVECGESISPQHYMNDCNGGCFSYNLGGPFNYTRVYPGQTIFGRSFNYQPPQGGFFGDQDYYYYQPTESCRVAVTIQAEFDPAVALYLLHPEYPVCSVNYLETVQIFRGSKCATFTLEYPDTVPAGYCMIAVGPNQVSGNTGIAYDYRLTLNATPTSSCVSLCQFDDLIECEETADTSMLRFDCDGGCGNFVFGGPENYFSIQPGQTVCGRSFMFTAPPPFGGEVNDRDYYRFTVGVPCTLRVTATGEMPLRIGFMYANCYAWSLGEALVQSCATGTVTVPCVSPGTYVMYIIGNSQFNIPDRDRYRARFDAMLCSPCLPADSLVVKLLEPTAHRQLTFHAPTAGSYRIYGSTDRLTEYPDSFSLITTVTAGAGTIQWTDTTASQDYLRYVVIHACVN